MTSCCPALDRGHTPEGLVIVGLERDLLHGHDVPGLVVDGRVHLPKMTLT